VLGEIHGCLETKSSKRGKRLSLQTLQQNVILASFEVCGSAFKDGPKRTDWAPEGCFSLKTELLSYLASHKSSAIAVVKW